MTKHFQRAAGFSMIELLFAAGLFTVIAGTVFSLLLSSQWRYQSENSVTGTFQQANIVMDQIVRDIHSTGYPPASSFSSGVPLNPAPFAVAFPWSPNYPNTTCTIGLGGCAAPGDYDLVLEADFGQGVQWIRYSLNGTTLKRGMIPKAAGDPFNTDWSNSLTPYLENVMNNGSPSQIAAIQKQYPSNSSMFPGGNPVPIFTYVDARGISATSTLQIHEVNICLIVESSRVDPQSGQLRVVTLTGQAVVVNPNQ